MIVIPKKFSQTPGVGKVEMLVAILIDDKAANGQSQIQAFQSLRKKTAGSFRVPDAKLDESVCEWRIECDLWSFLYSKWMHEKLYSELQCRTIYGAGCRAARKTRFTARTARHQSLADPLMGMDLGNGICQLAELGSRPGVPFLLRWSLALDPS